MRISDWSSDVCSSDLAVTGNDDHIHLILPDATERAACFRALAAGGTRIVRAFANADAWLDAEVEAGEGILPFRWRQPGAPGGAALQNGRQWGGAKGCQVA